MFILMLVVFVIGYAAIAFEHTIRVDKAASALLIGTITWTIYTIGAVDILPNSPYFQDYLTENPDGTVIDFIVHHEILHHLAEIAQILFFLLGAMTIVELIDSHEGFAVITDRINTGNRIKLLWIISILTFFFSAALDNLTTSIVMVALLRKLIKEKEEKWFFGGMVILAANSGGAWSPIGDITTIMLWIGGQVTAKNIILNLFIPSLVCMLVPLIYLSFTKKGEVVRALGRMDPEHMKNPTTLFERNLVFVTGVCGLLFVPVFKTLIHLPPFMGMTLSLGVLWVLTEVLHRKKNKEDKTSLSVIGVLQKVDVSTVYFFLGILLAVASLQSAGHLGILATWLNNEIGNIYVINMVIGALSAIVDNVPLVAGAMGMYELGPLVPGKAYPVDHEFWEFLAYCAGTGGSMLIIGSAAGVAVMGMEKIDFIWYIKKISVLAMIGYLAGAATYLLLN
ncbi:MAG TPA: sodium:proton antiporter [Flavobacteriales bacterium]|nr:sodium:proton antiporter [Flavobacteriales bacterium]